jgi:hypothetical protein
MHLRYAIHRRRVPVVVERPGLDAGNVLASDFAVAGAARTRPACRAAAGLDGDVGAVETGR